MECTAYEERADEKERTVPQRSEPQLTMAPETSERDDDGDDGVAAVVLDEATRHEASREVRGYRDLRARRSETDSSKLKTWRTDRVVGSESAASHGTRRDVRSRTQTQRSRALIEPET